MTKKKTVFLGSLFGVINIMLSALGAIFVRRFFVANLGVEYLGITAIFSSILGVLLALDCGIAGSLFYKIYKPLSDHDEEKIASVFRLIRAAYFFRAILILVVGIIALFFLPKLCESSNIKLSYIFRSYVIYLILTTISYYIILYSFFIEAIQKRYIVSIITAITYLGSAVLQIMCLVKLKSYLIYIIISLLQPIITYCICRKVAYKEFPLLKTKRKLVKDDLNDLSQIIKIAVHTLGTVIASYTDAFLITAFVGLSTLGLYDNYKVISTKVSALLDQITSSMKDPMRLLIAEGNKIKVEEILQNINFLIFCIAGLCSLLYLSMITPFVKIWLGNDYILGFEIVLSSAFTLFLASLNYITVDTYYCVGCYKLDKKAPIIEIVINLGVSFILGRIIGIAGVLIGTIFFYFVQEILRTRKLFEFFF